MTIGEDDELSPVGELPALAEYPGHPGADVSIDTLAYYLPYHFYPTRWGIFLKTSGILHVASLLKGARVTLDDQNSTQLARQILFEHEFFHFVAETACARAEIVAQRRLYDPYYPHPYAAPHEEGLANAFAFRRALVGQPASVKSFVSKWMRAQGPGYREFERWLGRARFDDGCQRAAHYMLQAITGRIRARAASRGPNSGAWGVSAPSQGLASGSVGTLLGPAEFLFVPPNRNSVPTRLFVDAEVGIFKPLPKEDGMRVLIHTREHPPPHFHVELDGRVVTKYLWPELTPYPGQPPLSNSEMKTLRRYVEKRRDKIDEKIRKVAQSLSRDQEAWNPTGALANSL